MLLATKGHLLPWLWNVLSCKVHWHAKSDLPTPHQVRFVFHTLQLWRTKPVFKTVWHCLCQHRIRLWSIVKVLYCQQRHPRICQTPLSTASRHAATWMKSVNSSKEDATWSLTTMFHTASHDRDLHSHGLTETSAASPAQNAEGNGTQKDQTSKKTGRNTTP